MIKRRTPAWVALAGLTMVAAACGGGGSESSSQVASLGGGATDDATATTVSVDAEEALLEYAACMRENGVDMQDPTVDADGNVQGGFGPELGIDPGSEEFRVAQEACGDLLEGVTLGGGPRGDIDMTAVQDAMNSFTDCLRDEGLDVDDVEMPQPGERGPNGDGNAPTGSIPEGGFEGGPPPSSPADGEAPGGGPNGEGFDPTTRIIEQLGLDTDDPTVTAAIEACQPELDAAFSGPDGSNGSTDMTEAS